LVNQHWLDMNFETNVLHGSDHSPLLVTCKAATDQVPRSFRFLNVWVAHHSFLDVVREAWSFQSDCRPIKALLLKLKKVKEMLLLWNKDVFCIVVDRAARLVKKKMVPKWEAPRCY